MADKKKHAGGRPTKYKPEYNSLAEYVTSKGFTDEEIARLLGVSDKTIDNWKVQFPEFLRSLKKGKEIADDNVERSLYQRATGYSHPDVHITNFQGKVTITPIIKHYAPDPTSIIFWLKNRRKEDWRDRQEHDITSGGEKIVPQVVVFREQDFKGKRNDTK